MDKEKDCFNALEGRIIKKIGWEDPSEEAVIIETQDGLSFRFGSNLDAVCFLSWVDVEQVYE